MMSALVQIVSRRWLPVLLLCAAGKQAWAGNFESGARRAQEDIVPKVAFRCGVALSVTYEGDSLRKNNQDIGYDQTSGSLDCDEPLRYLWYACDNPAGKAAVKAAGINKVVCTGVKGHTGSLVVSGGTITVGRAFEEEKAFVRSRKQFEAALKIRLKMEADDPYADERWHNLEQEPNPVTSTTTYCLKGSEKVAYDENIDDSFVRRKQDAKLRCLKNGETVIDLDIQKGVRTGYLTRVFVDGSSQRVTYRDGKANGEQKTIDKGKVKVLAWYENNEEVWSKKFHPSGKLARYRVAKGYGELALTEDGRVTTLRCVPALKGDAELRRWCGFQGAVTTSIYDGTGKVTRIETWLDGVIQKEAAGTSDYAPRVEVAYKDGKKQGEERVLAKDGKATSLVTWNAGVKDGRELTYADDGKRVVKEIIWNAGDIKKVTELYLNGNPKLIETYETPKRKQRKTFWDSGKVSTEGTLVWCDSGDYGFTNHNWCEDGLHKAYFENGAAQREGTFKLGKRHGPNRTWWENGKAASIEDYAGDKLTKAKTWDKDGKLLADEEYEADGSRKLKRP